MTIYAKIPMTAAETAIEMLYKLTDEQLTAAGIDIDQANTAADDLAAAGITYDPEN